LILDVNTKKLLSGEVSTLSQIGTSSLSQVTLNTATFYAPTSTLKTAVIEKSEE